MNLKNKKMKLSAMLIACLIVALAAYVYSENAGPKGIVSAETTQELALTRPAFSADAVASSSFLNQEAGISIWLNATASAPLDTSIAEASMTNVENYTSDYVIGSLSWAGLSSNDYPHCFVDRSGWIVVYYLKVNALSPGAYPGYLGKIIDWSLWQQSPTHELTGTFLTEGMSLIAGLYGLSTSNAHYYHFQYPSATELLFALKGMGGGASASFNIEIPGTKTIYEYSWAYDGGGYGDAGFSIDGTTIYSGSGVTYGGPQITDAIFTPNIPHTVTATDCQVCILLLYS
jgi:hypothetical protein